jgi:tRNA (guanine37-N1)-methyltransferase
MKFNILTLFPGTVGCFFKESIIGRAVENGILSVNIVNIRDYSTDKHQKVDDSPFGGGRGMLLQPDPIFRALEDIGDLGWVVHMSPMGSRLEQRRVRELSTLETVTLICGRYEGIDHRVIEAWVDEEISIGDYVLTGGEAAACVLVDCVARELEGTLGAGESKTEESFDGTGLLEYEQYTRPASYRGMRVPGVLISGNHEEIRKWRMKRRLLNTMERRSDLLSDAMDRAALSDEYKALLSEIEKEKGDEGDTGDREGL